MLKDIAGLALGMVIFLAICFAGSAIIGGAVCVIGNDYACANYWGYDAPKVTK